MALSHRASALAMLCLPVMLPAQPAGGPPAAAHRPRYVDERPYDAADHVGWQSMFDGRTLHGWEGTPGAWRVENGALVAADTGAAPNRSVYLYWKGPDGGELGDFEFLADVRLEGEHANSGVQFRAQMLGRTDKPDSEWESFGYQADIDYPNVQTGALIECCAGPRRGPSPRPFRASMGSFLRTTAEPNGVPATIGSTGDPIALKHSIRVGDWNQIHVIAHGTFLLYFLNGRLMSGLVDEDPTRFLARGRLAIQLEGSGPRKVAFRNIWVKQLN